MSSARPPLPIVVLISGNGSNLQSILDASTQGRLPAQVRAVISNRPQAGGLARAQNAGVATAVVDHTQHADRTQFERALMRTIDRYQPGLVVLAGFMRILGNAFVAHYEGRLLNIHPSLLPNYRGLNTHHRALADGATEHGASVHFVTRELDGGPVVVQARVPIHAGDDAACLAARVLEQEHMIYPQAIAWFAQGRLRLVDGQALLDGSPIPQSPSALPSLPGQAETRG